MHVAIEDADFELDSMVVEWMQLTKCEKSLKLFQAKVEKSEVKTERNQSFVLDKFEKFVREQENERKTNDVDDLGFEINFGTFQKEPKVRLTSISCSYLKLNAPLSGASIMQTKNRTQSYGWYSHEND